MYGRGSTLLSMMPTVAAIGVVRHASPAAAVDGALMAVEERRLQV